MEAEPKAEVFLVEEEEEEASCFLVVVETEAFLQCRDFTLICARSTKISFIRRSVSYRNP